MIETLERPLSPFPLLYVAYSPRTQQVRWFEVSPEDGQHLANDVTQVDVDDIRRAYRRLDSMWFAYLSNRASPEQWSPIRQRMIEIRGAEMIRRAESFAISNDYRTPTIQR